MAPMERPPPLPFSLGRLPDASRLTISRQLWAAQAGRIVSSWWTRRLPVSATIQSPPAELIPEPATPGFGVTLPELTLGRAPPPPPIAPAAIVPAKAKAAII